jgi:hypothetical protein
VQSPFLRDLKETSPVAQHAGILPHGIDEVQAQALAGVQPFPLAAVFGQRAALSSITLSMSAESPGRTLSPSASRLP